jgi:peptidoglycan/LPS O-acetylase OafA/YrhL
LAGVVAIACYAIFGEPMRLAVGGAVALALVPLCRWDLAGRIHVAPSLMLLGAASYAIYLIHNPLVTLLARGWSRLPIAAPWWLVMVAGLGLAVAAGLAYHRFYEQPALRWARRLIAPLGGRAP